MSTFYIINYSDVSFGWVSSERKTALCNSRRLSDLLHDSRYTIWSASWVNPDVDKIQELERI